MACAAVMLSGCAVSYSVTPQATAGQEVRYLRGVPTVLEDRPNGAMQVTPLGVSQGGRVILGLAAFNKATANANFGIENLHSASAAGDLKVYSKDELEHEARVRAEWAAFAAVLAGAAAGYAAQQNAYSTTNGYIATPRGVATFSAVSYDPTAAAIGTAGAAAATGYTLNSIKNNMDDTISHLNGAIIQTTTISPGESYGGEVIIDMPKGKDWPKSLVLNANWNGQDYGFAFDIAKSK